MTSKREELDNNKEMNKLLKDNSSKMEIAKEIQSNKKIKNQNKSDFLCVVFVC